MTAPERRRRRDARAEGQRMRIIRLLEAIADVDERDQCPKCGRWYTQVSSHVDHCDGPD